VPLGIDGQLGADDPSVVVSKGGERDE